MGFFDLTPEDMSGGKAVFKAKDVAILLISSITRKDINQKNTTIVEFVVVSGDNAGLKHTEFFNMAVEGGRRALVKFLMACLSPTEIQAMNDPSVLINRKVSATFSEYKGYINASSWKEVSDVPDQVAKQPVQAQAIVNPVQAQQQGLELSKGIFN